MASIMTIRLNKNPGSSWGFRLQGGKDFATPLCIQKVNVGSVAEQAGLQAGDAIVSINNSDALAMRHKEAQDAIVKAGNNFELVVQRGSQIWKPAVTALPETKILSDGVPVATKTSLAANQKTERKIGSNYNCVPRPFPGSFNKSASPSSTFKTNSSPYSEIIEETKSENTNGFYSSTPQSFRKNSVDKKSSTVTSHPIFNIDEATLDLTISGTGITLDKEKAKNFLIMTLDKENNVNTINLHKSSNKEFSPVNGNINGNSFRSNGNLSHTNISGTSRSPSNSSICSSNSLAGRGVRKLSYGSNCSSVSSASSHDGDNESTNIYQKDTYKPIGTGHNTAAAPFQLVNAQYNSPVNIYSEDSIAETLSAQAEVLGKGVLGINFKKYAREEKIRTDSPTYKLLHGEEEEERKPRPVSMHNVPDSIPFQKDVIQDHKATPPPQNFQSGQSAAAAPSSTLQPGDNICYSCQTLITGVFVRIKNKNLHADCFKCSTCGSSLKNVGYYNINDKLYCDIHAKQAARSNPPAPNLVPVTVQPGAAPPPGILTAPQASKMKIPSAFQQGGPAFAPAPAPAPAPPQTEVQQSEPQELPEPLPAPVFESTHIQSAVSEVSSQSHLSSQIVENEGVVLPPILNGDTFTSQERAPAPAPAPVKPFAPAPAPAPVAAPVKPASAPSYSTSANPQGFGAPAGDINVRAHIPKKGDVPAPMTFAPVPAPVPVPISNFGSNTMPKPIPPPGTGGKIGPGGPPARGVPQAPGHRSAPRRGRGVMNQASASRIPVCNSCQRQIRGPFVSALGKTWCPDHFICATTTCKRNIIDMGFVEEKGLLYCENCYESFLAPICGKCDKRIKGDCLNAVGKQFHPECFCCAYCGKVFGSGAFYLEDGLPYCETDWNDLFTTKCVGCNFPIEAGDRWVEALNNNYHSQCFKCSKCNKNLEGQSFFAKGGKPFCKAHAQRGLI